MLGQIHYRRHLWGSPLEGNHVGSDPLSKTSLGVTIGGESCWVRSIIEDIFGGHHWRGIMLGQIHYRRHLWGSPLEGNHVGSDPLSKTSLGVTIGGESCWVRSIIEDIFGGHHWRGIMLGQIHYRRHLWGSPLEGNHVGSDPLSKTSLGVTIGGESCWVRSIIEDIFGGHHWRGIMLGQIHYRRHLWGSPLEGNHVGSDPLSKTSLGVTIGGESCWVRSIIEDIFGGHHWRGIMLGQIHYRRHLWGSPLEGNHVGSDPLSKTSLGVTIGGESCWVQKKQTRRGVIIIGSDALLKKSLEVTVRGNHTGSDALLKTSLGVTVGGNHIGPMRY